MSQNSKFEYSERQLKVSETLKRIISDAFNIRKSLAHIIGDIHVTVSEVRVSPDLRNARIYILPSCKQESVEQVITLINEYSFEIQKNVAKGAKFKFTPKLLFVYDDLFDQAGKIEDLINKINHEDHED